MIAPPRLWFDITASFNWHRAPTGITRVEQECCRWVLENSPELVRFCIYDEASGFWYLLPHDETRRMLDRPHHETLDAPVAASAWQPAAPVRYAPGDTYLCLNADQTPHRLQALYAARQAGVRVIGIAYDIIQILYPHFYWRGADQGCARFFVDLAWAAEHIFCISDCTRRDLLRFYQRVGAPAPETSLIRLGDALPRPADAKASAEVRALAARRFILVVGTLEIRKNHETLYRALLDLLERGEDDIPLLVFAGMRGWRVDDLIASLETDPRVRGRIHLLFHASDDDLVVLYRHCLFTAFPSLYEGWGLPVAESLVHGKFCLASNAGAIPEIAGDDLVELISPYDVRRWADRLLHYARDPAALAAREAAIRERYGATPWPETAANILRRALPGQAGVQG